MQRPVILSCFSDLYQAPTVCQKSFSVFPGLVGNYLVWKQDVFSIIDDNLKDRVKHFPSCDTFKRNILPVCELLNKSTKKNYWYPWQSHVFLTKAMTCGGSSYTNAQLFLGLMFHMRMNHGGNATLSLTLFAHSLSASMPFWCASDSDHFTKWLRLHRQSGKGPCDLQNSVQGCDKGHYGILWSVTICT